MTIFLFDRSTSISGILNLLTLQDTIDKTLLSQEQLKKFILYARQECRPKLHEVDQDKVGPCSLVAFPPRTHTPLATCVCPDSLLSVSVG